MHELGVLLHAMRTVDKIAKQNNILQVKHVTLQVGEASSYLPMFLEKLFPVASSQFDRLKDSKLIIEMSPGRKLLIKDIGY